MRLNREKRKRNPLVAGEIEGRPIHQSQIYFGLKQASGEFGKKLKIGINRVGGRELWVHELSFNRIGVTPVVQAHGLRLGIHSLDVIEKKRKITSMPFWKERFGTKSGWWSERVPQGGEDWLQVFSYAGAVTEKGRFEGDLIRVHFIPPKTPSWFFQEGNSVQWHRALSANHLIQIRVRIPRGSNLVAKKEAYRKRFPFLWKNVEFEFVEH